MSNVIILTGGDEISQEILYKYIKDDSFVICADKGGETAYKYNIKTDIILGDFDSIDKNTIEKLNGEVLRFPEDKDFTDTEIALEYASKISADEIIIMNATGNRLDHTIANFMLLQKYMNFNIKIIGNNFMAFLLKDNIVIENMSEQIFSLIPLSQKIEGLTLEGFKFELNEIDVNMGDSICISNIIISSNAKISLKKGNGIIIITGME